MTGGEKEQERRKAIDFSYYQLLKNKKQSDYMPSFFS
jgi:hypothetical protein